MPYATQAQAETLYGVEYIALACDRDGDGAVDVASFAKWLEVATREMNMYLLGRYPLPLSAPPEYFQQLCVDIAVYQGAATADVATNAIEKRYMQAIKVLEAIRDNKVKLETATDATEANQAQTAVLENKLDLSVQTGDRLFRRNSIKGLF